MEVRCYKVGGDVNPERLKAAVLGVAPKLFVQTVRATAVSNESMAEMIVTQTLRASAAKNQLAKKPEIDLLLRLAGTTQIAEAIRAVGTKPDERFVLVAAGEKGELEAVEGSGVLTPDRLPRKALVKRELIRVEEAALLTPRGLRPPSSTSLY